MSLDINSSSLEDVHKIMLSLETEVRKRIIGMDDEMKYTLICLFAGGHVLLEGVPGLAKTLFYKTLAEVADVQFRRISFAADLLPKDVIGIEHFDPVSKKVELVVKGPLHTNFLLTDELNRARTSSKGTVLEPMEEGQVTTELGGTYILEKLFMVIATQNPVESEGTYGLGRAEVDRFMMKILMEYPKPHEEEEIVKRYGVIGGMPSVETAIDAEGILTARDIVKNKVHVEDSIVSKIQQILNETRPERTTTDVVTKFIERAGGVSPRAGISIVQAARVHAVLQGNDFVTPNDIVSVINPILRHRLVFKPGEIEEGEEEIYLKEIIDTILKKVL
jgi:MoxR-like ATPase